MSDGDRASVAVRNYAATFPQLVSELRAQDADDTTLDRIRSGYETAQLVFDGWYRGCGEPFVGHMVRTASVLLSEDQPLPVLEAALVHSAYDLWSYDDPTRRRPRRWHRWWMQRRIGAEAEALVWGFHRLNWPVVIADRPDLTDATEFERRVLSLYVANEVSNHLDLGKAYREGWPFRERLVAHGDVIAAIARDLGFDRLAKELEILFSEHLEDDLPEAVAGRPRPYELPARRRWQGTWPERRYIRLRRRVGNALRARRARRATPGPYTP